MAAIIRSTADRGRVKKIEKSPLESLKDWRRIFEDGTQDKGERQGCGFVAELVHQVSQNAEEQHHSTSKSVC